MSDINNTIQIKRGSGKPDGQLAPYELGYDVSSKILYIGGPLVYQEDGSATYGEAIALTGVGSGESIVVRENKPKIELTKPCGEAVSAYSLQQLENGTVSDDNTSQKIVCVCTNLKPNTTYTIKLYTMQRSRGNAYRQWRHPSNEYAETENGEFARGECTGYINIAGTLVNALQYPEEYFSSVPTWMPREGILQTEWQFTTGEKVSGPKEYYIYLGSWLLPLLKPVFPNQDYWTMMGLASDKWNKASRLFRFSVQEEGTNIESELSEQILAIGSVKAEFIEQTVNVYIGHVQLR